MNLTSAIKKCARDHIRQYCTTRETGDGWDENVTYDQANHNYTGYPCEARTDLDNRYIYRQACSTAGLQFTECEKFYSAYQVAEIVAQTDAELRNEFTPFLPNRWRL